MPLTSGTILGPYEVIALLGAGGMGEVYRATDSKLRRNVALKVLPQLFASDAQRMGRFEREAQLLASLNHPNIATIHGLEESGSIRALVMELVEGPTLGERIAQGPVPLEEALPMAKQIAEALEYAHERGIIHRDLKPANIKLTKDSAVKVLDFGLAKALADDPATLDLSTSPTLSVAATRAGFILGTAAYMAPEQARGKPVDRRADIWSFGAVFFEMLSGKVAFAGETISDTLAAVIRSEPDWDALPKNMPPQIRQLLRRCLEKDARRRLQAIGEARYAVEEAIANPRAGEIALAPAPVAPAPFWRRALPWAFASMFLAAALALSFAVVSLERAESGQLPVRAFLLPPESASFGGSGLTGGFAAVSPDGKTIAFLATAKDGRRLLWVRPLESLVAQPLAGTENASYPFWSPDSRSLGFFAQGKLKRIEASGGPTVTISDVSDPRGGAWNADGVILFTPNVTAPLFRISAAGGTPEAITKFDPASKVNTHRWPQFLPDGRHFLYLARGPGAAVESGAAGIYVSSLDGKESKLVVRAVSSMAYASGYLLFVREGTLMAQPFDARRLTTTGDAFPVAEQIGFDPAYSLGAFSVSENGVLAYLPGGAVQSNLKLTWVDRSGKELSVLGDFANYFESSISPDGKKVAVNIYDAPSQSSNIWIYDAARGLRTRFTFDASLNRFPVWSADGSRIVFTSNRKGHYDLYVKPSGGAGTEELLVTTGLQLLANDWSRDDRFLLYESNGDPKTGADLWVLPLTGERKPFPFLQTPFTEQYGKFSPDGKWVAYTSNESGIEQVYVAPFPGPGGKWQISTLGGTLPGWRQDGKEILYLAPDNNVMAAEVSAKGSAFEIGVVRPLFKAKAVKRDIPFDVARDAQRFLVNRALEETSSAPITLVLHWNSGLKK
jgi:serine/threonine protein kinase/Tol biopolymer transport system component